MGQPMHASAAALEPSERVLSVHARADESEWEYEYDQDETEDFYFTLDLTTHAPNALNPRLPASDEVLGTAGKGVRPWSAEAGQTDPTAGEDVSSASPVGKLQIIDLHKTNPLVKLDDEIYNCYWSTDLGTQFHVAHAGVVSNPRRAGTVLDVVGTSQARLLGKHTELEPRQGRARLSSLGISAADPISVNELSDGEGDQDQDQDSADRDVSESSLRVLPGEPLRIPRERCKNSAAEVQASFLERLSEIKLKKGETDQVPIYSIRIYEPPANMNELREKGLADDVEKAKRAREEEPNPLGERRKRHRPTYAERGIENGTPTLSGRPSRDALSARVGFQDGRDPQAVLPARRRTITEVARQPDQTENLDAQIHDATGPTNEAPQHDPVLDPSFSAPATLTARVSETPKVLPDDKNQTHESTRTTPLPSNPDSHNRIDPASSVHEDVA